MYTIFHFILYMYVLRVCTCACASKCFMFTPTIFLQGSNALIGMYHLWPIYDIGLKKAAQTTKAWYKGTLSKVPWRPLYQASIVSANTPNIADYVQKLPKTQEKHTAERFFWQPKFEEYRNTHSSMFLIFLANTCEFGDTLGLFPLFVFEVKIYCMQNDLFLFYRWVWCCLSSLFLSIVFTWQPKK